MDVQDFRRWQTRMGFDGRGGQKATAEALGLSVAMVRIYENGQNPDGRPVNYPLTLRLAMSALALDVRPWPVG
ncbi:hypothetical protein ACFQ4O_02100 [Methylopila musalis]|uniref:HTH cro/C1-type domain-containing protein n=1 Tax=Methylopila musalis TaxID=1134781 RepID=A0ABW3Z3I6_9HYPH